MGRKKTAAVVSIDTSDVTPATVVQETFPAGIPVNPDGTVASQAEVTPAQIQRIGAVNAESAKTNRKQAKMIARKQAGENVRFDTDDPMELFDLVSQMFPSSGMYIYINEIHPEQIQFQPVRADSFRTSAALYDHLLKVIHKTKESAKYEIIFKDSFNKQHRAKGTIQMPNTLNDPSVMGNNMNQPPPGYPPPPPYGYPPGYVPPQGYPPQPGYLPQGYYSQGQPQPYAPQPSYVQPYTPQPQQQQQPSPAPAPAPVQVAPPTPPQPQPPQQSYGGPPQQPPTDPLLLQILQRLDTQQQQNTGLQMQLAGALGAVEEFKRLQATQQMYPQQPPQPQYAAPAPQAPQPPPQPQAAPPPQAPGWNAFGQPIPYGQPIPWQAPMPAAPPPEAIFDRTGRFLGYMPMPQPTQQPAQQPQQPQRGVGAMPQIPPPPPPPQTPQSQADSLVNTVLGMRHTLDSINAALSPVTGAGDDDDDTPAAAMVPVKPPPVTITPLGIGSDPWVMATRDDGKLDTLGTILGNLGQLPKLLHTTADGLARLSQQTKTIQHNRPINAVGHVVEQPVQQQRALPQAQPQQQIPPPPPPPPQQGNFMPNFDALVPR